MSEQALQHMVEEELLSSYESMYRLAYTYVRNEHDALDIVQECVYRSIKNSVQLKEKVYVKPWIWRILINTANDFFRKKKREVTVDEVEEAATEDVYQDIDMLNALNVLSNREKTVIILHYFEDMRIEDVAESMGENVNTVKSVLYRSLKKLKAEMTRGGS